MPFKDEVAAGDVLIYTALRSENWVLNTTGWRLTRAGDADLNNVTVRGTLQSANFVTGSAGYKLNGTTGDAELNQLVARGSIATDVAGQARVLIQSSAGSPPPAGVGLVEFYSARPEETAPGRVRSYGIGGPPTMFFEGPDAGFGVWQLEFPSDGPAVLTAPSGGSTEVVLSGAQLKIPDAPDVTTSSGGGIVIGFDGSGTSIAIDDNEIMARDASVFPPVAATLNLQNNGGLVQIGAPIQCAAMRADDDDAAGNVTTTSTTFVTDNTNGPNFTFEYTPSGRVLVLISADADNSGAGFSNMSFRIRNTNAAGAIQFTGGAEETARHQGTGARSTIATFAVVTGLPTSGTGFIEGLYLASSGTATFRNADITVVPVM